MSEPNLRHRAETALSAKALERLAELSPEEVRQLVHELSVHQVELEMQNQDLLATQLRLEESQREFFDLFNLAPIGFVILDAAGRIQKINQAGADLLNAQVELLTSRVFYWFIQESCRSSYSEHQHQVLRSGGPERRELQLVDSTGAVVPVRMVTILQQKDKDTLSFCSALIDQTENRIAWEELEKANLQLKRQTCQMRRIAEELTYAEQRERQRLAKLLHDHLQQLLVAAKINLELTHAKIRSANLPSKLTGTEELCEKAGQLLSQSLATSRSLAVELSPPVLQEGSLLGALRWLSRWMLDIHGLTVNLVADRDEATLPEHILITLFEITRELLLNVVKHSGVKTAQVTLHRARGKVQIEVADEGKGFDPSELEAEDGPSSYGMLTARHRISWMQGSIVVQSSPGQGCRVRITIPESMENGAATAEMETAQPNRPAVSHKRREDPRIRVLVADDHHVLREGLAHIILLEPGMLVVGEAANGREAVELTRQTDPDVVVMDINMPVMNGIEATRLITAENPHVHVIGLSMHEEADVNHAIRAAGADAYLSKGSSSEELIAAIRQCTGKTVEHAPVATQ